MPNPCDQLEDYGNATSSVFGTGLTSLVASAAAAVSLLFSAEMAICDNAATAQSVLIAPPENIVTTGGGATSVLSDRLAATNTLSDQGTASSAVTVAYDALAVSTADATTVLLTTKENDCSSFGAATDTVLSGAVRAPMWVMEAATAYSTLTTNNPDNGAVSSGAAVSSTITAVRSGNDWVSTGNADSLILDDYAPGVDALTRGSAVSSVIDRTDAQALLTEYALAVSTLPVPPSDQAWVANLETHAMWRYKDFAPRWLATVKGAVVALTDAGLCEVSHSNDVAWYVETGWSDLGEQHKKRVIYTYVGGEYPASTLLEVGIDMRPAYHGYALRGMRATIGKGLNARYWRFRVSGVGAGSLLDIRSDIAPSARRI